MDERLPPFSFVFLWISKKLRRKKKRKKENPRKQSIAYKNPFFKSYIVGIDKTPNEFFAKENRKCLDVVGQILIYLASHPHLTLPPILTSSHVCTLSPNTNFCYVYA